VKNACWRWNPNNETHRYTREELDGIRAKARADLRALKQQEAA